MALRRSVARRGRASAPLDPEAEEWSIYVVEGEVNIAARHSMGAAPHLSSGGQRAACERYFLALRHWRPRYIWWNFVSSRRSGSSKRKRIGRQENFHQCQAKQNSSDIGDGWQHTIKIERSIHPLRGVGYPRPI